MPQEVLDNLTIMYDFSCQAAVYASKREPEMFARTKFLIDRYVILVLCYQIYYTFAIYLNRFRYITHLQFI
jgi:hypothetical protein